MSTTYTSNTKLRQPALGDTGWSTPINENATILDGLAPVGGLCVTLAETPSASLNVKVAAGKVVIQDGSTVSYAGTASQAVAASSTKVVYLDGTTGPWNLTVGNSYPTTAHVRLATVVTGGSAITSITDDRQAFNVAGTILEGTNIALGTVTGTKIGTATSQKLGFLNATPVIQQTGGSATASGSYGATEQGMLQKAYDCLRSFGLLS